jgi:PAS domain S-box-containing protein
VATYDFRFERLFEEVGEAAFILDPAAGRILAANPARCALLGYTLNELLAIPVSRIHPGELPQLQDFVSGFCVTATARQSRSPAERGQASSCRRR